MREVTRVEALREVRAQWRAAGERLAFVPTMGNLHAGHLRLVERAFEMADRVAVSIFVNPLQFSPGEDFANYPRTLEADRRVLADLNVDLLFVPGETELYAAGREKGTRVHVPGLSEQLCGAFRPGHFEGVATVVAKLFNVVQPEVALFGRKDYQQLLVIRRLAADLNFPVEIVDVETVREPDGLAMSSRNRYLAPAGRKQATLLYRVLRDIAAAVAGGSTDYTGLETTGAGQLAAAGFNVDYVAVRRRCDLRPPGAKDRELVALAAARIGGARLIDNVEIVPGQTL